MTAFTPAQEDALATVTIVCSAISMCGSLFIIFTYLYFKQLRTFAFKLVVFLSVADVLNAIASFLGHAHPDSPTCYLQAYMISMFSLSSVLWTTTVAYTLQRAVRRPDRISIKQNERWFHLYAWGLPFVLTVLPQFTNSYGPSGLWCWIVDDTLGTMWRFVQFYIPLWGAMLYNAVVYAQTMRVVRNAFRSQDLDGSPSSGRRRSSRGRSLLLYPMVLFVCWSFGTVNRIQNSIAPSQPIYWLYFCHGAFSSLQGLFNSLVYGLTDSVQRALLQWLWGRRLRTVGGGGGGGDDDSAEGYAVEMLSRDGLRATGGGGGGGGGDSDSDAGIKCNDYGDSAGSSSSSSGSDEDSGEGMHGRRRRRRRRGKGGTRHGEGSAEYDGLDSSGSSSGSGSGGSGGGGGLLDRSHQVRGMYLKTLGVYELMGMGDGAGADVDAVQSYVRMQSVTPNGSVVTLTVAADKRGMQQRRGGGGTSVTAALLTLFKGFVGLGVLALPHAFHLAGWLGGTLGLAAVAAISYYCMSLLLDCKLLLSGELPAGGGSGSGSAAAGLRMASLARGRGGSDPLGGFARLDDDSDTSTGSSSGSSDALRGCGVAAVPIVEPVSAAAAAVAPSVAVTAATATATAATETQQCVGSPVHSALPGITSVGEHEPLSPSAAATAGSDSDSSGSGSGLQVLSLSSPRTPEERAAAAAATAGSAGADPTSPTDGAVARGRARTSSDGGQDLVTFGAIGHAALGWVGAMTVDVSLVCSQLGFATAYLIFIGNNVNQVVTQSRGASADDKSAIPLYVILTSLLLLPLVWLRSLKRLAVTSLIADVIIVFGLATIFGYDATVLAGGAGSAGIKVGAPAQAVNVGTYPLFFGLAVYTFEGIGLIIPIQNSMARPRRFRSTLRGAMVGMTSLFVAFGAVSYAAFGDATRDMVTLNLPHSPLVSAVQLSYCLGLMFTFPIMLFPALRILETSRFYNALPGRTAHPVLVRRLFRTALVACTVVVALCMPHFGLFINIIGSIACSMLAFVLPTVFHMKLFAHRRARLSPTRRLIHMARYYAVIAFGVVGGLVSFSLTVVELIKVSSE